MKLLPLSAVLCVLLCAQPSLAQDKEDFNSVYKAFIQVQEAGEIKQTLKLAEKVLKLGTSKYSDDEDSLTNLEVNLAIALTNDGQVEAAEKIYQKIRQSYKKQYGEVSQPYFLASLDLLDLYSKPGWQNKKTEKLRERASTLVSRVMYIAKKLKKEGTPQSLDNYYLTTKAVFGGPGINSDNYSSVVKFAEKAKDHMLARFGEGNEKTMEARYLLGQLSMTPGQYRRATKNFEALITTIESNLDTSHPYKLSAHTALIEAYEKLGKSKKATEHCIAIGKVKSWKDDIKPIPLYRVSPRYPLNAVKEGKSGFTKMTFDIDKSGFVTNIKVIDSSDKQFEKESIAALNKWRYAPKFEDGQAIVVRNIKVQLDFTLSGKDRTKRALRL